MGDEKKQATAATGEEAAAPSFGDAMAELEAILERIEGEEVDVDRLAEELRRAAELLDLCRGKIRRAETEVTQVVQRFDEAGGAEKGGGAEGGEEAEEGGGGRGDDDDLPF